MGSLIFAQQSTGIRAKRPSTTDSPFYTGHFDTSISSLPPSFKGHDMAKIYSLLLSRQSTFKRGEFESISNFLDRIDKEKKVPLIGKLSLNDLFVFTFTPTEITYEILDSRFYIYFPASSTSITWQSINIGKRSYIGQNAFGVKARIHEVTFEGWQLKVNEDDRYMCGPGIFKGCFENVAFLPMETGKAALIKKDIRFLVAGRIVSPYVSKETDYVTATIETPLSSTDIKHTLHIRPTITAFYNVSTGQLISKRLFVE